MNIIERESMWALLARDFETTLRIYYTTSRKGLWFWEC